MRGSSAEPGVIPLAVHDLFDMIQQVVLFQLYSINFVKLKHSFLILKINIRYKKWYPH